MRKRFLIHTLLLLFLLIASPVYAQSGDVDKVQNFALSIIRVLVTMSGIVATGFFVWGGFGYITSSGNPEALEKSKRTVMYSAIGLTLVLAAFVLSNIVTQLSTAAFGATP